MPRKEPGKPSAQGYWQRGLPMLITFSGGIILSLLVLVLAWSQYPWIAFAGVLAWTVMVTVYVRAQTIRDVRIAGLMAERTAQLRRANTALQQTTTISEDLSQFLDSVLEYVPLMLFVKDAKTLRFVRWNKASEELVGLPQEAVLGKTDYDLFLPEEADFFTARDREVLAAGHTVRIVQAPIHTRHKGARLLQTRKVPIYDAEGQPRYLLGISEDITERLQTEEALRLSEERYRLVVESSLQGILIHQDELLQYVNPACLQMFGYASADELLGRNIWDTLLGPASRGEIRACNAARWRGEQLTTPQGWQGLRQDGTHLWVQSTASTIVWQGRPATLGFLTDVTAQRQAEEALRASEARFRDLIEGSLQGIVVHRNLKPLFANQAYAHILGYDTPEDIVRLDSLLPLLAPVEQARVTGYVRARRVGSEVPQYQEHQVIRQDGTPIWVDVKAREVLWYGEWAIQATVYDITERKQAEAALRKSQAQLQEQQRREQAQVEAELARTRDQLVAQTRLATLGQVAGTIAHELRNPLGAVRNAVYYLRRYVATDNPELTEFLQIIDVEVSAADRIINNLLEMSRAKQPMVQAVDLAQAVSEAFGRLKYPGQVRYDCCLDPIPFIVHADPVQLQQVLSNLLTNAVQAMAGQGEVAIAGRRDDSRDMILMQDTGPGIPSEARARIFEPLFSTKAKGTGLGLTICRQIIERHGGSIDLVDSTRGAAFSIVLPRHEHMREA